MDVILIILSMCCKLKNVSYSDLFYLFLYLVPYVTLKRNVKNQAHIWHDHERISMGHFSVRGRLKTSPQNCTRPVSVRDRTWLTLLRSSTVNIKLINLVKQLRWVTHDWQWWIDNITCVTPIFLQASKKFSTFRRHLAMLSFGWRQEYQSC